MNKVDLQLVVGDANNVGARDFDQLRLEAIGELPDALAASRPCRARTCDGLL